MGYLVTEDYCWRKLILWSRLISFSRTKTFIVNVQAQQNYQIIVILTSCGA